MNLETKVIFKLAFPLETFSQTANILPARKRENQSGTIEIIIIKISLSESSRVTNLTFEDILDLLHELGSLYESSFDLDYKNQDELDELLRNFYGGSYDLTQLMKEV